MNGRHHLWGSLALFCLSTVSSVQAACSSNLVIDNYSKWSSNTNSQGSWTSDDGTMQSISVTNGKLKFTPKSDGSSYFYETLACIAASTDGYDALMFPLKGPAGGSLTVEVQTSTSCSATAYTSWSYTLSGLTGSTQTATIPLSSFNGANLAAVKAVLWSGFSTGSYELGQTSFVCKSGGGSGGVKPLPMATSTSSPDTCQLLLIDDWASQSRLTFLFYNAMLKPSSHDDTMTSVVVSENNRVTLTSKAGSYFYSGFGCINAANKYGGISLRIKGAAGTTFSIDMQSSNSCDVASPTSHVVQSSALGWTFDGTEKLYLIQFSKFSGLDLTKLVAIVFQDFNNKVVTFGPMAFYCGNTGNEYIAPPKSTPASPTATVPATSATASAFVIDTFANSATNALGYYHGGDDVSGLTWNGGKLTIKYTDSDFAFYTQLSGSCRDMRAYNKAYIHVAYTGSSNFSIALQQHNSACDELVAPFPETWDEVFAPHYATKTDIYVPIAHFNIEKSRVIGIALKGFFGTAATILTTVEIVKTIPSTFKIPAKIPTAPLIFACKRPNSFAFAIDDGDPKLAQDVMSIVRGAGIKVTFFTVGAALLDSSTNLTNVYLDMLAQGHQVALHTYTHPKIEGLASTADIDWEINNNINAMQKALGITSKYVRPPFGNEGARFRERSAALILDSQLINWSVDVQGQDWLWAETQTPEKQIDSFKADVAKGGNLVVMHYLYPSTVSYLPQFIQIAKQTGKQLMRVDQCMEDPSAPPL